MQKGSLDPEMGVRFIDEQGLEREYGRGMSGELKEQKAVYMLILK